MTWRAILWSKRVAHGASMIAPISLYCLSRTDSVAAKGAAVDTIIYAATTALNIRLACRFSSHGAKSRGFFLKATSRFVSEIAARQTGSETSGASCSQTLSEMTICDSNSSNRCDASAFLAS